MKSGRIFTLLPTANNKAYVVTKDTVRFINDSGRTVWKEKLFSDSIHAAIVDNEGNFLGCYKPNNDSTYYAIRITQTDLLKSHFRFPRPKEKIKETENGGSGIEYGGSSFVTSKQGIIYKFDEIATYMAKGSATGISQQHVIDKVCTVFEVNNSTFLVKSKKIVATEKHKESSSESENGSGKNVETNEYYRYNYFLDGSNCKFVGTLYYELDQENYSNTKSSQKSIYISKWQIIDISSVGKIKKFIFEGKGTEVYKSSSWGYSDYDESRNNEIFDAIFSKSSPSIILFGSQQYGKYTSINGHGTGTSSILRYLSFYTSGNKTFTLNKQFPNGFSIQGLYADSSGNFLMWVGSKLYVCNPTNGNILDSLVFVDTFIYFSLMKDYLLATMGNQSGRYLAKFSYPYHKANTVITNTKEVWQYSLAQNYPNPFNPQTAIRFLLLDVGNVSLKVYNVLGQEVAILLNNETMEEGEHEILFDASALPSGIYFYRLQTETFASVRKMLLLK